MTFNLAKLMPALQKRARIAPDNINHEALLNVVNQTAELLKSVLPKKRSGYSYETIFYAEIYAQLTGLSTKEASKNLQDLWKGNESLFQSFEKYIFINGKKRRAIPDQPTLTRFSKFIADQNLGEEFANVLLWAQFLYALRIKLVGNDLTLIADYNDEPCKKNREDPYCFGTQKGKAVHRTLVFSIISNDLHLVVATFKIKKMCHKLPFFETVIRQFQMININVKYFLLDRGFYRRELLERLKEWQIDVIIPGRKCKDSKRKIMMWIQDKSGRRGKFALKLKYVRQVGQIYLIMDIILYGKKGHTLSQVKKDFKAGLISEEDAAKRIFPLFYIKANNKGVKKVKGSENYIRDLYRKRWAIEIAFRTSHVIGIRNWLKNRDSRLLRFGFKCFIYNQWQISRVIQSKENPDDEALTLKEFCGRLTTNRSVWAI
jgi:hypothetical protein